MHAGACKIGSTLSNQTVPVDVCMGCYRPRNEIAKYVWVLPNLPYTTPDPPQSDQTMHEVRPKALACAEHGETDGDRPTATSLKALWPMLRALSYSLSSAASSAGVSVVKAAW